MRLLLLARTSQARHYVNSNHNPLLKTKPSIQKIVALYSSSTTATKISYSSLQSKNNEVKRSISTTPIITKKIENKNKTIDNESNLLNKILIANRGEIACRVIQTCKRMGIPSVAIYSNADGNESLHVSMADEAYCIGHGPTPSESYLLMDEVIEIAKRSNAAGIHPGYGFLSENAIFAQKCKSNNINFIGPPINAIEAMGSKSESKEIMQQANVPVVPGYNGRNQDNSFLYEEAVHNVGFPCLIKATMGGGGKGMRLVLNESEFLPHLESCQRESKSAFGDSSVILERYLTNPRHIEYQVFGDTYGNVVHLYERDCSIQRRHQKVIEEGPASDLNDTIRSEMGDVAVRAAKAIGYVGAGTVEFLLDGEQEDFYFCEMNTRLQVEHPITEMITGYDLVEWQIRVASGEKLPVVKQEDINEVSGHAIECRIYAENPWRDFLPATGKLLHLNPPSGSNIRVESGVRQGDDISVFYDPMISKLIVHGPTRQQAILHMIKALRNYQIVGVTTNIPFLLKCVQHSIYQQGNGHVTTNFLVDYASELKLDAMPQPSAIGQALFALYVLLRLEKREGFTNLLQERNRKRPWSSVFSSFSIHGPRTYALHFGSNQNDDDYDITAVHAISNPTDGSFQLSIPNQDQPFLVNGTLTKEGLLDATINQNRFSVTTFCQYHPQPQQQSIETNNDSIPMSIFASTASIGHHEEYSCHWSYLPNHEMNINHPSTQLQQNGTQTIKSPMPGKVIQVNASINDHVESGDILIILEAMKMEHSIHANATGIVTMLQCDVGDIIADGTVLALIESSQEQREKE